MNTALKFIVADDHPMVRQGVGMVLELEFPGCALRSVDTYGAVVEAATLWPDATLLIDLDMPGMEGIASLRALRLAFPALRIAVHSGSGDRQMVLDALGVGVNGYILKASPADELLYAISTVLAGRIYVTERFSQPGMAGAMAPPRAAAAEAAEGPPALPQPAAREIGPLTRREAEVLECLLRGQSNKHIASQLGIGEGTVKVHLASIFKALGARNRTEAALIATERGLVPRG